MDLLTQSLLGATAAVAVARRGHLRRAAGLGLVAGLLPDADILFRGAEDPLLWLQLHRHFTHALVFVPFGALLAVGLTWPFAGRVLGLRRAYLCALAAYGLAPLVDAATSYGTHLLWPFTTETVAWSIIAIVDPVFTGVIVAGLGFAVLRRRPAAARWGLVLGALYLGLGVIQHERAEAVAHEVAAGRGHRPERLLVKPTFGNLLLWRAVYVASGTVYADGVRVGPGGGVRVYPGDSVTLFDPARHLQDVPRDSVLWHDIERFRRFAAGYLARPADRPHFLGDVRYAMLPTSVSPLWGIQVDPEHPGEHARYVTRRELDAAARSAFLAMLRGRPLPGPDGAQAAGN